MPWFIIQCERKTWTKYIVEAENEEDALASSDNWQYMGYLDGEDTVSLVTGGSFKSAAEAKNDLVSYVEGR